MLQLSIGVPSAMFNKTISEDLGFHSLAHCFDAVYLDSPARKTAQSRTPSLNV